MATQSDPTKNISLLFIITGIIAYIVVDSGMIDLDHHRSKITGTESLKTSKPDESVRNYSKKLKEELGAVEKELIQEKKTLTGLQKEVDQSQSKVKQQKNNLKQLEQEIATLQKLKKALVKTENKIKKSENQLQFLSQKKKSQKLENASMWNRSPSSIDEIQNKLAQITKSSLSIEPVFYNANEFIRLNTKLAFSRYNENYLSAVGINQAKLFTEGILKLGYRTITLAHRKENRLISERVEVLHRFLVERYGKNISISSLELEDASIPLNDGLELWAGRGNQR